MKINKPHVFLHESQNDDNKQILVVLVPRNYENVEKQVYTDSDAILKIKLSGDSTTTQYSKHTFIIDAKDSSNNSRLVTVQTIDGNNRPLGFTKVNTNDASTYWNENFFCGVHLETDDINNPTSYTMHFLASDFQKTDFRITNDAPNGTAYKTEVLFSGSFSSGKWDEDIKSITADVYNDANCTHFLFCLNQYCGNTVQKGPFLTPDGKVIIYHADADDDKKNYNLN
ncbi:MAG: hypothetical protein KDC05_00890 [Bacteroidales bacterium]|nr:hypothetical protein [Bacteroidales bacterium]